MFVWMRKIVHAVAFLSFVGHARAEAPAPSSSPAPSATAGSGLLTKIEDKKAQLMSGSKLSGGASFTDDVLPLKLVQSLVRLNEYGKRQATELKELQNTRALMERRLTQMHAQLDKLNKDIPGIASSVQSLAKDPQKNAQWQDATTKMYVAVAQSERLKQLIQRYQGALKRLDGSKQIAKLAADAKSGSLVDKAAKKSATKSTAPAAAQATAADASTGSIETPEPDVMTEVDAPVETSTDTGSTAASTTSASSTGSAAS